MTKQRGKDEQRGRYTVQFVAGYWRLSRDRKLVATFGTKREALAGLADLRRKDKAMKRIVSCQTLDEVNAIWDNRNN